MASWIRGDEPGSDGFSIILAPIPCYPADSLDHQLCAVTSSKTDPIQTAELREDSCQKSTDRNGLQLLTA